MEKGRADPLRLLEVYVQTRYFRLNYKMGQTFTHYHIKSNHSNFKRLFLNLNFVHYKGREPVKVEEYC